MRKRTLTLKLTLRKDGMWCKYVAGRMHYFGTKGCDEATARRELTVFLNLRDAGVAPGAGVSITVKNLADRYAATCEARVASGEGLQARTWNQYDIVISEFVLAVGRSTPVSQLGADQFAAVARKWRKIHGVHRCNNDIQAIRTMFKWAFENGIIDRTPVYGREFAKAAASAARIERHTRNKERGERRFTTEEVKQLVAKSTGQLHAMIWLGLNGGLYSVDISDLKWADVCDEDGTMTIDTTRHKTGIPRHFVLWPETLKAVQGLKRNGDRMFSTRFGNSWNHRNGTDSIGLMFGRFRRSIGVDRAGLGFGSFRHTHVSAVGDHPDQSAARMVRGHQIQGIESHYDFPSLDRIRSVTDLARKRLLNIDSAPAAKAARGRGQSAKIRGHAAPSATG